MSFWKTLWDWITLKPYRMKRARQRYELLKKAISYRHFNGFAGLVLSELVSVTEDKFINGKAFGKDDFACFKSPMYFWIKNQDGDWCVFWDRARLTREIGTGAPLKEGELMILENSVGRMKPSSTLETIDEQKPLVSPAPM
jgi:hypothetical protein